METRITEQPSHYDHLEQMTVEQITGNVNRENMSVAAAVGKALPYLNRLIEAIEQRMREGGRLFYVGCGTGGRLAAAFGAWCQREGHRCGLLCQRNNALRSCHSEALS